ncbi:MAG: tail fiber domain-containing protein, partial [Bacteroidetes bacterium]
LGNLNNGGLDVTNASILIGTATSGMAFDANQIETAGSTLHLNYNVNEDVTLGVGGGSVAVGHTAPATKLDVLSTGWQFRLNNDGAGGGDWFIGASNGTWAAGGDKFLISPNNGSGNSEFVIESTGQIGMGTTAPSDRLQVDADAGEDALRVRVGGITRLRVHDNGGVSVGANAASPTAGLRVTGESRFDSDIYPGIDNALDLGLPTKRWDNVWATNGVIQTSDRRLKTDISPSPYGLTAVMALQAVTFRWRDQPQGPTKVGLIAQEVQAVVPEVVQDPGPEAYLGVNYAELAPVLIQAIQEQQAQIEAQSAQIQAQQAEIDQLKAILSQNQTPNP